MARIPSDGELLVRSRRQPDAFLTLFDRHFDRIARYVARRAGSHQAEELASEVFVRAFANRRRYDEELGDVVPWLYGIATNVLREHARQEERELALAGRAGAEIGVGSGDEAESALAPAVARALLDLPLAEREALLLHVWADLEYRDVAAALDVPLGTVKSRINRARVRLRAELEACQEIAHEEVTHG